MIIKTKHSKIFIFGILLLLVAFFLVVNKKTLLVVSHDTYENYMSTSPGFSTARNLIDSGGNNKHQSIFQKLKLMAVKAPESILYQLESNPNDELKNIKLLIDFSEYREILKDRENAIRKNYLENPANVAAKINFDGNEYKANVRLKGDLGDHWLGKTRMSLRVNLKNSHTAFGFNKFSIHKPRARQYPYEQAFQESLRSLGNITSNHNFARVNFNGEDWGIMNIEEHMSKEFLEKQGLKDSLIFRFSDDKKWLQYNNIKNNYPNYRYSDPKLISTVYQQEKYLNKNLNRKRFTYVLEQRLKKNHSSLYSKKPHLKAFFNALLWNNQHTLSDGNSRYYLNPYTLELEPITTDQGMFLPLNGELKNTLNEIDLTETYKQVLTSFRDNSNKSEYLTNASKSFVNIEEKLNQYNQYFPLDAYKSDDILSENINLILNDKAKLFKWLSNYDLNKQRDIQIKNGPNSIQAEYFPEHLHVRHYDDGRLLFFNLLPDEVIVDQIVHDGFETAYSDIKIPGFTSNKYEPYVLQTNLKGIQDNKIIVHSSYDDNKRFINAYPTLLSHEIINPLSGETTKDLPFLVNQGADLWEILPGQWIVDKPIIIDGSLIIKEGVHLKLSDDAYLIVKGGIDFSAKKTNPIIFEGLNSGWKGLYVLSNDEDKAIIHNVVFNDMTGLSDGLLALTGGINIYRGSADLRGVTIDGSLAEDALNIISASISIEGLNIQNTSSDAFDCDYCKGTIKESSFERVGGDAIDFSGSKVEIDNIKVNSVKDKALSVGEASNVQINNSSFTNVGVGIASKDGSEAIAKNVDINNYNLHAAMTYSKKSHYDPFSSLYILDSMINDDNSYLRQKGTLLVVNGEEVIEQNVNVDELYSSGVMKK